MGKIAIFSVGVLLGIVIGVLLMCLLQVGRANKRY